MWAALAGNVDICAPCLQNLPGRGKSSTSGACSEDMLVKSYDAAADYAALSCYFSRQSVRFYMVPSEQVTERGESALMKAAANGHWEAKLLLVHFWF